MEYIILLFTLYVVFILLRFKGIESISKSAYLLKRYGFLFSIWLALLSILIMYYLMDNTFMLVAGGGLFYTAITPTYKDYIASKLHYSGVVLAILSCVTWMLVSGMYYYTIAYLITVAMLYWYSSRPLLYIELVSFYAVMFALHLSNL